MSKNKPLELTKQQQTEIDAKMYPDTVRPLINETPTEEPIPMRMDNLLEEISTLNLDINEQDEKIAKAHSDLEIAQVKKGTLQERHVRATKELRKLLGEKL